MKLRLLITLLTSSLLLTASACEEETAPVTPTAAQGKTKAPTPVAKKGPAGKPASAPSSAKGKPGPKMAAGTVPQIPKDGLRGQATEILSSGGYLYIHVKAGKSTLWVATDPTQVKVGDTVDVPPGLLMTNFTSKTLNRTFPQIFFVNGIRVNGKGAMPVPPPMPKAGATSAPGGAPASAPASAPSAPGAGAKSGDKQHTSAPAVQLDGIKRAEGGQTVAEIYRNSKELSGKPIKVRGKVVKYLSGIMGRNWLHIQDGTGDPATGSHDLTVTTDLPFRRNDTVVVEGILTTDKDFGQGYFYKLIVEKGKIATE